VSKSTRYTISLLFVCVVCAVLVGADLIVTAQNANSSTTMQNDNMSEMNTNTGSTMRGRRRRGRRRARNANMTGDANANLSPDMQDNANANMAGNMQENTNTAMATPRRRGGCDPTVSTQEDLSGTYTGTINYPDGGMTGEATITISGSDVTITSGGNTLSGKIAATTTCNYTAAAMMFGTTPAPGPSSGEPPVVVSTRVRRTGSGITFSPVPGVMRKFSFTSGGGGGRRGRRGRRSSTMTGNTNTMTTPDTTMTGDANANMNMGTGTETNTNMSGGRRRRRGRRSGGNMNSNMNSNTNDNMNMNGNSTP
jgi:hypothetical protein